MEFGIVVLGIIIILDLVAVYYVFRIGVQHDAHTEIRSADSSHSVMVLKQRAEEYNQKIAARDAALKSSTALGSGSSADAESTAEGSVSNQLGDEEERQKRREAALKRKAERQATRTTQSQGE